jgi:hypothetical protein
MIREARDGLIFSVWNVIGCNLLFGAIKRDRVDVEACALSPAVASREQRRA